MMKAKYCILMLCLMAPTWAHGSASEAEKELACKDDALRLCSDFIPERDKITLCMQKKVPQLSPACKAIFEEENSKKK